MICCYLLYRYKLTHRSATCGTNQHLRIISFSFSFLSSKRSGYCRTANQAQNFFGNKRTMNNKGITIPSQQRYVRYYAEALRNQNFTPETIFAFPRPICRLKQIVMHTIPNFKAGGGCDPSLSITQVRFMFDLGFFFKKKTFFLFIFEIERSCYFCCQRRNA